MKWRLDLWVLVGLLSVMSPLSPLLAQADREKKEDRVREAVQQEEMEDYFTKWLKEDVVYIISPEERTVFEGLTTTEEKEQFIEQFWYRRDPDLRTPTNEFKDEHYRRIAYANERFSSGYPGWMSDRGRIYIIHGPPAEIEAHPTGGAYNRPIYEGGGTTSTFPFEIWRYRYIEGIGNDVELEFVDKTMSGEYRMALIPEEKDALLYVPGAGLTLAEELGESTKADRPFFNPNNSRYQFFTRAKDNPFTRYETFVTVQRAPNVKYKDLQEIVEVGLSYENLPFKLRDDYVKLNENRVLVPVTLQVENKDLTFQLENGVQIARVAVYGIVTSITNRVITEFDDDLVASYRPEALEKGLQGKSVYQKMIPLDPKMRYKLDLVVKDINSGNVGVIRKALIPPAFGSDKLEASSLILSDYIKLLAETPKEDQMFVIGDVWVRPKVDKIFSPARGLGVYLQLHNQGFDQSTLEPSLQIRFRILKDGQMMYEFQDDEGNSVQYSSEQRVVLIKGLPLRHFKPGRYRLEVEVADRIKDQSLTVHDDFTLVETEEPSDQAGTE